MQNSVAKSLKPVELELPVPEPRHRLEWILRAVAHQLDAAALASMLGAAVGELDVGLCLHRVGMAPKPNYLTLPPEELDALLELMLRSRPERSERWLTLAFDDGYSDAVEYVRSRAPLYPEVEWLVFVCPAKSEQRIGFCWDDGQPGGCPLADVAALRSLARLPNVSLGNHTNSHRRQVLLSQEEAQEEYATSFRDFERLFGECRHFAFPFGTPELEFGLRHVELLRQLGDELIWSTEQRPHRASERQPGAVLPRFPIDGTWTHREIALWICAHTLRYRLAGARHHY